MTLGSGFLLYFKKHKKKTSEASRFFWNIQALSSFYLT